MATYSVTCSNVGSFTYGNRFTLYVKLSNRDGNPATNKSVVDYEAYFENTSGGGTFSSKTRLYFAINGQVIKDSTGEVTGPRNGKVTIAKGSITVDHNPDGNKSVGFQALVQSTNFGIYGNIENSFELTKIPRYTSITRFAVNKRDETSVTFDYATSDTTDYAWYSKDNGSTWSNLPTNNIVTGLSANTTYNFKLRVRRKDSQLTTDSGTYAQTTYNYPYCTEAPDFVIGNNVTVKFYNPLNRSIQIRMWSHRSAQFVSDLITTSGTSYTGFSNIASNLYASIPNHTNSRYNIDVHYGSNKAIKEGGNYRTVGNEAPSFYNFTYRDTDAGTTALTGNNQTIVKGYSNVEAIVSTANKATPKNSASMSKYRLSIGEATAEVAYSSSAQVATTIANVSSNSFTMYAIDSRGYSTAKTITASTYINYSPIKITSISLTRTNSVTEETTLRFSGTIWNGNFGKTSNAVTDCYYRFRETTSDQWFVLTKNDMNITPTQNGDWFSFTGKIKGDLGAKGFDMDNSYIVQIFIADKLSNNYNNPATFTLGPGTPAMAIYKNNVAIGQRYATGQDSKLQVNGHIISNGQLYTKGSVRMLPAGTDGRDYWNYLANGIYWYANTNAVANMPQPYGWIVKMGFTGTGDFNVLFFTQREGAIYRKSGNADAVSGWKRVDIDGIENYNILMANDYVQDLNDWNSNNSVRSYIKESTNRPADLAAWGTLLTFRGKNVGYTQQLAIGNFDTYGRRIAVRTKVDGQEATGWNYLEFKPFNLYENADGTLGTVTLSHSAAEFRYLEIFFNDTDYAYFDSVKIPSPNGRTATLDWGFTFPASGTRRTFSRRVKINGTSIANLGGNEDDYGVWDSWNNSLYKTNKIRIVKVVGYK